MSCSARASAPTHRPCASSCGSRELRTSTMDRCLKTSRGVFAAHTAGGCQAKLDRPFTCCVTRASARSLLPATMPKRLSGSATRSLPSSARSAWLPPVPGTSLPRLQGSPTGSSASSLRLPDELTAPCVCQPGCFSHQYRVGAEAPGRPSRVSRPRLMNLYATASATSNRPGWRPSDSRRGRSAASLFVAARVGEPRLRAVALGPSSRRRPHGERRRAGLRHAAAARLR